MEDIFKKAHDLVDNPPSWKDFFKFLEWNADCKDLGLPIKADVWHQFSRYKETRPLDLFMLAYGRVAKRYRCTISEKEYQKFLTTKKQAIHTELQSFEDFINNDWIGEGTGTLTKMRFDGIDKESFTELAAAVAAAWVYYASSEEMRAPSPVNVDVTDEQQNLRIPEHAILRINTSLAEARRGAGSEPKTRER